MGFLGAGIRGAYLLESFAKTPGVRPVAVADLYDGRLARAKEAAAGKIDTTRDYRRVLDRSDIDAVAIATPDHWHARMALDALDSGKHVYVEKPMTWSIAQGLEVVAAEKRTGRLVMVGSQSKTAPSVAKAREIVKSGLLGKVVMVRLVEHRNSPEGAWLYPIPPDASPRTVDWPRFLGPAPEAPFDAARFFRWRCWWEYSGGVATDLWVHLLTALHEIMDVQAPRSVAAQGGIYRWNDGRTVPDVLSAVYEYDGFVADIYANLANARGGGAPIVVMGSEATLTFDARGGLLLTFEPAHPGAPATQPDREIAIAPGLEHYEYFVQSLREGLPSKENAMEGHCAAGAAHLANLAFQKGRRMTWDAATSAPAG
jgi:predicted dehydrogenase